MGSVRRKLSSSLRMQAVCEFGGRDWGATLYPSPSDPLAGLAASTQPRWHSQAQLVHVGLILFQHF